jgi:hypothetical protein
VLRRRYWPTFGRYFLPQHQAVISPETSVDIYGATSQKPAVCNSLLLSQKPVLRPIASHFNFPQPIARRFSLILMSSHLSPFILLHSTIFIHLWFV